VSIEKILDIKVSYQDHFWTVIKETTLKSILEEIRGEKHQRFTNYLREFYFSNDMENYGIHKRQLPVVTFCGSFKTKRTKDSLKEYNYLVVLDIDKLGLNELERVKQSLLNDKYVFSFWESPSKDGVKGLVHIKYNFEIAKNGVDYSHKIAFNQLVKYFGEKHSIELDRSGSDITRLCFVSCDKMMVLKEKIEPFEIENSPVPTTTKIQKTTKPTNSKNIRDLLNNPKGKNNPLNRKTLTDITKFLTKNSLSVTHLYKEWYTVAFAICNSFTFDIGLKYFIGLSRLDVDKFDENECKNFLINCYENSRGEIGFNSIYYLASKKGFKNKKGMNAKST
jgi:hypothetical protein